MKICFPVETLQGPDSEVFGHFGSAPGFIIVNTEVNNAAEQINNGDQHHAHGMCQPLKALGGRPVDAIAVGRIGMGALMKLQVQGIRVFRATPGTVGQNMVLMLNKTLPEFDPGLICAGHTGGGCAQ
jgi:predicted Fe-Mo cluster-binding NifX family protein